jgi:hypothetical protein
MDDRLIIIMGSFYVLSSTNRRRERNMQQFQTRKYEAQMCICVQGKVKVTYPLRLTN